MRLPNSTQKILIIGRNGSGKSVAAVWHLSRQNYLTYPWVVFNHKREELINEIPGAIHIDRLNFLPTKPGIYIYTPQPEADDDAVEALMWAIYRRGKTGVYIDEGYMINPRSPALNTLYTQGRSLHIPMITLSQRPARISRFAVSESHFYQIFHLVDKRDRDILASFVETPDGTNLDELNRELPEYHSLYYDVSKSKLELLLPVPDEEIILKTFHDRFSLSKPKKRLL